MTQEKYRKQPLLPGHFYHIYNRGNNGIDVFFENENYEYFLKLYHQYIHPIAETFAWCLMKNHFHVLVYMREENKILQNMLEYSTVEIPKKLDGSRQFGHLFNAYTQAVNKRYGRTGSLFEKPFERKPVDSEQYLKNLIFYIHHNPVHHGFTTKADDYPWSSYSTVLSEKCTKLKRDEVIGIYGTREDFIKYHEEEQHFGDISGLMID